MKDKKTKNRDGLENSDHWATPDWLYKELDDEFHFDFDPCPLNSTFDGLKIDWKQSNYINPPYNRFDKPKFIDKAYQEFQKGKTCVLLIPASTGTIQFHELFFPICIPLSYDKWKANKEKYKNDNLIIFMKGRLAFKGINTKGEYSEKNKGKHDSVLVILRNIKK